jgi:hypothetical protein
MLNYKGVGIHLVGVCLIGAYCMHAQEAQAPKKDDTTIKSAGCVRAGVEAGCLVLKGFKDKKNYSLHFPDKKPDADTAIAFEGTDGGVDTCNQGTVVKVTKWTPLKTHCPKASETKP